MARVLVVDDEPKLAKLTAEMLALDGHEVARAGGGREALALLAAQGFDVVVTDLRRPDVDGLAVLPAARAGPAPPEVVVVTAYGTAENAVAAMKAGAADYVTKPFSMDELRMRADQHPGDQNPVVVVPRPDPAFPVVLAAWTHLLALRSVDFSRIDNFIALYLGKGPGAS